MIQPGVTGLPPIKVRCPLLVACASTPGEVLEHHVAPEPARGTLARVRLVHVQHGEGGDDAPPLKGLVACLLGDGARDAVELVNVGIGRVAVAVDGDGAEHGGHVGAKLVAERCHKLLDARRDEANLLPHHLPLPMRQLLLRRRRRVRLVRLPQRALVPEAVLPEQQVGSSVGATDVRVQHGTPVFLPAVLERDGLHVVHPPPLRSVRPRARKVPVDNGEVERRDLAGSRRVRRRLAHLSSKLLAEELHHEAIDRVAQQQDTSPPEPAEVAVILHAHVILDSILIVLRLVASRQFATTLVFGKDPVHPLLGSGRGFDELLLYARNIEEGVGALERRIFCKAGDLGIEEIVRIRNPASVFVVFIVNIQVPRSAVRVFAVVDCALSIGSV